MYGHVDAQQVIKGIFGKIKTPIEMLSPHPAALASPPNRPSIKKEYASQIDNSLLSKLHKMERAKKLLRE